MQDDAMLLTRLRRRDPAAFRAVFEAYSDKIYRLAVGILQNETEADGVVQDTFMRLIEKIETFKGKAKVGTWLYRVAYNLCQDRLRQRGRTQSLEQIRAEIPLILTDWSQTPQAALQSAELTALLTTAIDQLPMTYRAVLILRDVDGLSTRESADILNISPSNVKVRLHRARLQLREILAETFTQYVEVVA